MGIKLPNIGETLHNLKEDACDYGPARLKASRNGLGRAMQGAMIGACFLGIGAIPGFFIGLCSDNRKYTALSDLVHVDRKCKKNGELTEKSAETAIKQIIAAEQKRDNAGKMSNWLPALTAVGITAAAAGLAAASAFSFGIVPAVGAAMAIVFGVYSKNNRNTSDKTIEREKDEFGLSDITLNEAMISIQSSGVRQDTKNKLMDWGVKHESSFAKDVNKGRDTETGTTPGSTAPPSPATAIR